MLKTCLKCGDCLELMKEVPDSSVNLVLSDLPYGITRNEWDKPLDLDRVWREYKRVLAPRGAVVLFAANPFAATLIMSNPKWFRYEWVWNKKNPKGFLNANRMPLRVHELILVFYPALPKYNPQFTPREKPRTQRGGSPSSNYGKYALGIAKETDKRYPTDILTVSNASHLTKTHPTEKPVELLEYIIKTYTDQGDTVLDTCMGSGATGVASVHTSRSFIGFELNGGYFNTAIKRVSEAQNAHIIPP